MTRCLPVMFLAYFLLFPCSSHGALISSGAAVLASDGFSALRGKKFGLVTNRSSTVGNVHLLDLLRSADLRPLVIFGPEHGLGGTAEDGVHLADSSVDGILVRSLYGSTKKPRKADLEGLDVLVVDLQDVGARFYTYISTLGLVMQAAAEAGLPLMVLDRPNPLGGNYVSGFVRKDLPATFTSLYPIPAAYGMTVGELALMIKGERMLPGLADLDLTVVRMTGWQRSMRWPDTGMAWVPTSPNIPGFETALLYAGTCLLEGTGASEGRGTEMPFALAGWPGIDGVPLATKLNGQGLPGVRFHSATFTPTSLPGKSSAPKFRDKKIGGIRIEVTDYSTFLPFETGVAILAALYEAIPQQEKKLFFRKGLDDLAGSTTLRQSVEKGMAPEQISLQWSEDVGEFKLMRNKYLIYPPR